MFWNNSQKLTIPTLVPALVGIILTLDGLHFACDMHRFFLQNSTVWEYSKIPSALYPKIMISYLYVRTFLLLVYIIG